MQDRETRTQTHNSKQDEEGEQSTPEKEAYQNHKEEDQKKQYPKKDELESTSIPDQSADRHTRTQMVNL